MTRQLLVMVLTGSDDLLSDHRPAAAWLTQEIANLGSPYAWELTDWIEVTESK
jgi:hypothetical protein